MIWTLILIGGTLFVAYANGANDNFKGVATLFGSGTMTYRKTLWLATGSTLAGSTAAYFVAEKLVKTFSGKGLVPDSLLTDPAYLTAVILGAGLTVFIAVKIGIPISTTHSLMGALFGSGLAAVGSKLGFAVLGRSFFIPLLASPFLSMVLVLLIYPLFRRARQWLGVTKNTCVCIGEKIIPVGNLAIEEKGVLSAATLSSLDIIVDEKQACEAKAIELYEGRFLGIQAQKILDFFHCLSAGAASFARGLNDTPKILAIALAAGTLGLGWNIFLVALVMAIGGLVSARKVAETLSHRITGMNHGQGLAANLVTSFLVIFASWVGVPVSTTHVSCGSLFAIGLVNGKANWKIVRGIVSAWVLTLPIAALLAGASYLLLEPLT